MNTPTVYLHSAENMPELEDGSVDLFIGGSVHKEDDKKHCLPWKVYAELYQKVYVKEGLRLLKKTGIFLVVQTNAYSQGEFICRYALLFRLMQKAGYRLIDERVWERRKSSPRQVPFSHVLVFVPPEGTVTRKQLTNRTKEWWHGIFQYPETEGSKQNGWPVDFCRLVVKACTDENNLIVDAFAGKGNLLATAHSLKRRAVGYEIDKDLVSDLQAKGIDVVYKDRVLIANKKGLLY